MAGSLFAIGVQDDQGFHLVARIARRATGIYYLIPRANEDFGIIADENWDPHASYHADGTHHIKSFGSTVLSPVMRQPLNQAFTGAEPLFPQGFAPGDLFGHQVVGDLSPFREVFVIPSTMIAPDAHHTIAVDLLSSGAARIPGPWQHVVVEHSFTDSFPWIHVTLWRGLAGADVS